MSHRPPPPTKQPTEESGNWPALVITGREPAEQAAEGPQGQERRARGGKTPGRARGAGRRGAPEAGATGSRQDKSQRLGEPAEQAAEGRQRQERRARGGETPGRARGAGRRRRQRQERRARGREKPGRAREGGRRGPPEAGATGSRQGKARASPRSRPQRAARGRSDGLAAGQKPTPGRARGAGRRGTPEAGATGSRQGKAWASSRRWPQRDTGGRNDGLASEQLSGKRTKTRSAEAEQRPRCTVKPGMTQADGRPAERVSLISA